MKQNGELRTPWHSLNGKRVWVTGGAGYLGAAITAELDASDSELVCIDLPGRAQELVDKRGLRRTTPVSLDMSDAAQLSGVLTEMMEIHGVPDGIVHLAFASSAGKELEQLTFADFKATFDLALSPTFVFCRDIAERMKPRGGSIVLFSSMYGMVAPDRRIYTPPMTPNPIDYGTSKAAVLQLARYLAMHYGPFGIRFNCVSPGPFPNPKLQHLHPNFIADLAGKTMLNRIGANHEVVGPTLFLLGDGASFVTGQNLVVDGGWTAW